MTFTRSFALAVCLLATAPAQAGQPISVSMAECAGIMLALSDYVETPDRKDRILSLSAAWVDAANAEEGRDMSAVVLEKAETWQAKGRFVVFTEEFQDWTSYCGSLARHKKLDFVAKL